MGHIQHDCGKDPETSHNHLHELLLLYEVCRDINKSDGPQLTQITDEQAINLD